MNSLFFPSKTFLIGEYAALRGGRTFVLAHPPYFQSKPCTEKPFSPAVGCPTEKFALKYNCESFAFLDPHQGKGGFGASGAQFLSAYLQNHGEESSETLPWKALCEYKLFDSFASGTDVLIQCAARSFNEKNQPSVLVITKIQTRSLQQEKEPQLGIFISIYKTGMKIPTHEHLQKVAEESFFDLCDASEAAFSAYEKRDTQNFIEQVTLFSKLLEAKNLLAPHTKNILATFPSNFGIAKGCGALGADAIAVFHQGDSSAFEQWSKTNQLEKVGTWKI